MDSNARQGTDRFGAVPGGRLNRAAHAAAPWLLGSAVLVGVVATPRHPPYPLLSLGHGDQLPGGVAAAVVVGSAIAAGLARACRWPVYLVALAGWLTLSLWPPVAVAGYYTVVSAPPSRRRSICVALFGAAASLLVAVPLVAARVRSGLAGPAAATAFGVAIAALLVGLPVILGLWVDARRQAVAALRDRAERLEREQAARVELARAEERTRITHEMHDVVAHRVSLMVLTAGALEVGAADPLTVERAALIRTTGREALAELRQVLGVLRAAGLAGAAQPQPGLADLDPLVDRARAAGVPVERRDEGGPPPDLPPAVARAAYRVVQEALTNVVKHAGPVPVTVLLRHLPDRLEVTVTNASPPGPHPQPPPGGLGLVGLRERVGLLGGAVTVGATPEGGFAVSARIPWQVAE